ncbi:MAG TPA: hypothetical protein VFC99_12645 [Acidimicrobiia bacterium]|nr:hypothetical protein [Acidimicrobiia bacterium]
MAFTKKALLVAAVVAALLAAGVAFAAWTTGGAGHGSAKARTAVELSTVAVPASSAGLFPGADAKVTVRVVNDNDYPVRITDVQYGAPAATTVNGALGTCASGADAALTFTDQTGLALDVGAHASATFDVDGVHMGGAAANGCQGATFTIPVTLTGASNVAP